MINNSVLYVNDGYVSNHSYNLLDSLPYSSSGVKRLCLHESPDSPIHFMLIKCNHNTLFPIHSHIDSDEIISIYEGSLFIDIFNSTDSDNFTTYHLSNSGIKTLLIKKSTRHRVYTSSFESIYSEVKLGPFDQSKIIFY
jgi:cupin fold WbuC family metalloprotein